MTKLARDAVKAKQAATESEDRHVSVTTSRHPYPEGHANSTEALNASALCFALWRKPLKGRPSGDW